MRISSRAALPVVAVGSLVLGLSAPALGAAASHLISGSSIKEHSIAGNRLKANTLTGTQINESTLGQVPLAKVATTAKYAPLPVALTSGQTAAGSWMTGMSSTDNATASISYPVPLESAPTVHVINDVRNALPTLPAGCTGTPSNPGAKPGNVCIFAVSEYAGGDPTVTGVGDINPLTGNEGSSSRFGVTVYVNSGPGALVGGSWAVTAK